MPAALGVWGTRTVWLNLAVAALMAGLFLVSAVKILRQAYCSGGGSSPLLAPWGESTVASWASVIVGIALIGLSLPRGKRSNEHYGGWDRYIV